MKQGEIQGMVGFGWIVSPKEILLMDTGYPCLFPSLRFGLGNDLELGISTMSFGSLGLDIKRSIFDTGDFAMSMGAGGFISPVFYQEDLVLVATKRFDKLKITPMAGISFYNWTSDAAEIEGRKSEKYYSFLLQGGVIIEYKIFIEENNKNTFTHLQADGTSENLPYWTAGLSLLGKGEIKGHNYWAIIPGVILSKVYK
jgi:hypothetical protein